MPANTNAAESDRSTLLFFSIVVLHSQREYDATVDFSRFQVGENCVDVFERGLGDLGAHLASGRELERLIEVAPGSDDRAAHRDALQHHIEDRGREITGR